MDDDYVFTATGDACEVCQALDGMRCSHLPHANCQCSLLPYDDIYRCETHMEFFGPDIIGPDTYSVGAEITVICPHGTELGTTVQYIGGPTNDDPMGLADLSTDAANDLCSECPNPKEPFNCC